MRRRLVLYFTLIVVLGFANVAHAGRLAVKSAAVMDFASGRIVFEQEPYRKIPPASITKIMSLYLVYEALEQGRISPSSTTRVSREAADTGGSSMNLRVGEIVTVAELMEGMAVASGNDACVALAEMFGGVDRFVAMMNRKARELGMTDTTFVNPNGLPAEGQYTTAMDMLKLSQSYLKRFPQSLNIHAKRTMVHNGLTRNNSNRLLGSYKGVDGIKTGWVNASGYNIVATAKRNGSRFIAVVLGGRSWSVRNAETRKVLDICFAGQSKTMFAEAEPQEAPEPQAATVRAASKRVAHVAPEASSRKTSLQRSRAAKVTAEAAAVKRGAAKARNAKALSRKGGAKALPEVAVAPSQASDGYSLQESSWQDKAGAKKRAASLRRKGMDAHVVSVDLGSKGVWHRVMVGNYDSRRQAAKQKKILAERHDLGHAVIR